MRFALLLVCTALSVQAQTQTAQLTGRVADPSGAPIPQTAVVLTNQETGVALATATGEAGAYTFPSVQPGVYRIVLTRDGFKTLTRSAITLQVAQVARLDLAMELGAVSEKIEVTATAPLLDQETSSLGQVIDNAKIVNIPLNGRSAFRLAQLTPGVLSSPSASGQFGDIPVNTTWDANFSINGARAQQNEIQIDGVPSTTGFFNQITTIPSIEATQEFKVQSNNLSAEWGRFAGGVINVSTRGGTNQFHGAVYEFLRNSALDANEFFNNRGGRAKPPFRMNQFGGALGGPIRRNKTFFFGDYQATRWRRGDVFLGTLPTDAQRGGDFTQTFTNRGQRITIYDPLTSRQDPARPGQYLRDAFAGNAIPQSRIDPIVRNLIGYYPKPNVAGEAFTGFNNFISNAARIIDSDQFSGRVDHNLSDNFRTFVRIASNKTSLTQPDTYGNVATPDPGAVGTTPFRQTTASWDNTVTLGPSLLANFRYGFARWYQLRQTRSFGFDQTAAGFPASLVSQFQIPVFPATTVEQYSNLGGQSYLNNGNDTHTLLASLTRISGKHTIKAGIDVRLRRINLFNSGGAAGSYAFNRAYTRQNPLAFADDSGHGIATFLLGLPASGSVPIVTGVSLQNFYYAGYLQDDWRLTSRLTVNIGLRYETESPYTERRNQINGFNVNAVSPVRNAQFPNLTGGLQFASPEDRYVFAWDKNNIAPRIGFAYSLDTRTVLRWGAGLFYSPVEISNNAVGYSPSDGYSASTPLVASLDGGITPFRTLRDPFPGGLVQPTRNSRGLSTFLGQSTSSWDARPITPKNYQWNFNLQRELRGGVLIDASYAGSRGINLAYRNREINALDPVHLALGAGLNTLVDNPFASSITVGALAQPRVARRQLLLPYPQFTGAQIVNMTSANSIYHSFQLKAEKRFAQGVTALLAYTNGKLITDATNQVAPIGGGANTTGVQNWYDLRAERGISEMDVSQALTFSYVAELPFGPGKRWLSGANPVARRLAGGWQINGVSSFRTGLPLVLSAPIPGGGNRPNSTGKSAQLPGGRSNGEAIERWFDTSQFLLPAAFSLGNTGRTLPDVRGPGFVNHDFSLIKNTAISERLQLQFRAESFNILNRANFALPNTAFGGGLFGAVRGTQGLPRVHQFALKLLF